MKRHWFRPIGLVVAALLLVFAFATGCGPKKDNTGSTGVTGSMQGDPGPEQGCTIEISTSTDPTKNPDPLECKLSKGQQPDKDHVRWHNSSGQMVTLTFTAWPFMEPAGGIVINDGAFSPWFSLNKQLPTGTYTYHANPPFPSGGPGEPGIVDGP